MAHKILGSRFISRMRPAWHNIAQRIFPADERITATDAMAEVAGDIKVVQAPLTYELDGVPVRADKHVAIVRKPVPDDPTPRVFGITTNSWVAASYPQLASALNELSASYAVETAGVLKNGALAFLCFRGEDWSVRGDEMRSYFAANLSLNPGTGHRVFHSPVRVVCWNTNTMAQQQASINLAIPHDKASLQRIQLAARLVSQFHEMKDRTVEIFNTFADTHISVADAEAIFLAAFPDPKYPTKLRLFKDQLNDLEAETFKRSLQDRPDLLMGLEEAQDQYDRQCKQQANLRGAAGDSFVDFQPSRLGGTIWAAYNAVTEISDWREGRNADQSAIFGQRAKEKERAFVKALEIAKV